MIVTEEEAKTKRCQETIGNLAYTSGPCLGSACMAWRWRVQGDVDRANNDMYSHGYCGKAGKP